MANDDLLKALFPPAPIPGKNPFEVDLAFGSIAPRSVLNIANALDAPRYSPVGMLSVKPPRTLLGTAASARVANMLARHPTMLRKVYFAFAFDDVFRVNNLRQQGKLGTGFPEIPECSLTGAFGSGGILPMKIT